MAEDRGECPFCGEAIEAAARKCPHCREWLEERPVEGGSPDDRTGQVVADTVIGANLRWRDNVIQGVVVAVGCVLGAGVGAVLDGGSGALLGLLAGLVLFGLASGGVIMVLGFVRASR